MWRRKKIAKQCNTGLKLNLQILMIHCLLTLSHMTNSSDCSAGRLGTWFIIVSIGTSDCLAQTRLLTMNNYLILDTTISFMQDWEWIYTFAFHSYSRVKIRPITSKPTSCRQATCFSFQNSSFWPRFFNQMIYLNTHGLMTWTTINDSQLNQILPLVACKNLEFTNDHRIFISSLSLKRETYSWRQLVRCDRSQMFWNSIVLLPQTLL